MAVIKRSEIRRPALGKETVDCPALGGAVVVRGMTLSERLRFIAATTSSSPPPAAPDPGDNEADPETAAEPAMVEEGKQYAAIPHVLAWCVLAADGKPVMSAEEWEAFGSRELMACLDLFAVAKRLSLFAREDIEKKSESTPS